jgi:hypothetical protein
MRQNLKEIFVWNLLTILVVFCLCTGCLTNNQTSIKSESPVNRQDHSALPDIYTAPIGGFNDVFISLKPNESYTTNYTFYSRDWEGGYVDYQILDRNGQNFSGSGKINVTISQSHFLARKNQVYSSQLTIKTGPGFKEDSLSLVVRLQGDKKHYANDSLSLGDMIPPGFGILSIAHVKAENQTFFVKRGESHHVNLTFQHGISGLKYVTYSTSDSPLDITITPGTFISTRHVNGGFPTVLSVTASPAVPPGRYNFQVKVNTSESYFYSHQGSHGYSHVMPKQYNFTVDVTGGGILPANSFFNFLPLHLSKSKSEQ